MGRHRNLRRWWKINTWWRVAVWVLVTAVVVGCTGAGSLPPTPAPVDAGAGVSSDVVRVGVLTPMTGELATFGEVARNGVRMALDQWNEEGGVNGRPVAWVLADTECDAAVSRLAAERLVSEGVDLLVGGMCSESAIAITNVAQDQGVVFVAIAATHPLVTVDSDGGTRPTVFRAAYEYGYQARAAAHFLLEQPGFSQAVVVFDPGNAYERALAEAFVQSVVDGGGHTVQVAVSSPDEIDWPAVWSQLETGEPTALYVPGSARFAGEVTQQEGFSYVVGSETWRRSDAELAGLDGAFFTDHFDADVATEHAAIWARAYETAFAQEPETLAVLGYEVADLLAHAIADAERPAPGVLAQHLETMMYDGVIGVWRFDELHNPVKDVVVLRVTGGDAQYFSVIAPDWAVQGDFSQ